MRRHNKPMHRRSVIKSLALPMTDMPASAKAAGTELVEAAERGDLARVAQLLDAGADIEQRDARGRTPILAATHGKRLAVVEYLITRGADVNAQDRQQDSAFLFAGASGQTDIVRVTLAAGADLKSTNRYGGTALIPACHYGHVETVRLLLGTAIRIDHVNRLGWTALLEAVILGDGGRAHTDIVRLLITHGANVNLGDNQGVTPLQHAVQKQQNAIVALLRVAGAR